MKSKFCSVCKSDFEIPDIGNSNEHWSWVKQKSGRFRLRCKYYRQKVTYQTINGFLKNLYRKMRTRCENPKDLGYKTYKGKLHITQEEFLQWGRSSLKEFMKLNNINKPYKSGISIDKIDDNIGYVLGNLQWLLGKDNILKKSKSQWKKVGKYDIDGNLIKEYEYMNQVKEDGYSPGNVCFCCKGKFKQYNGFLWRYIK